MNDIERERPTNLLEGANRGRVQITNERRFGQRIDAPYPARLTGVDTQGRRFKEQTTIDNLSVCGSYLRLTRALPEGVEVLLSVRLSTIPDGSIDVVRLAARGTVVRIDPQRDGNFGVAVEFTRRRVF